MPARTKALVGLTQRLEGNTSLDGLREVYAVLAVPVDRWSGSELLRSGLIGHALHPLLTDLPLGFWTSATLLDLRGRQADREAAQRLVGAGLLAAAPTALTGLAEWARTGSREQRVGALHGALNAGNGYTFSGKLRGTLGGDGDWAKESLAFGFFVENTYWSVYRLWSRPWLVTK